MIEGLVKYLMSWCEKRGRVITYSGTAGPEDVYLIRYVLARNPFFSIYIHQFLRSDRDDLHDHPWHFMTYLVRGAYNERKWDPKWNVIREIRRMSGTMGDGFGSPKQHRLVFRKATDQHQVIVDQDLKLSEKQYAPLTLFFGGPVIREWGFIKEIACEPECGSNVGCNDLNHGRKWIPWREYLGLPPDHPSR